MYTKQFEIRWSDMDANRHLANSAYLNFMSHTRMAFLLEHGFSMQMMGKHDIGPVIFYEHIYYFKEAFHGQAITVGLEVSGLSEDASLFEFKHNFYNDKGEHLAYCEILGAWMDLKARKIARMPEQLMALAEVFPKTEDFRILTKEDTRRHGKKPVNMK